jgi:hypothetical protein
VNLCDTQKPKGILDTKPPIFVLGITHMQRLAATIEQVVNRLNCVLKIINSDIIKIIINTMEYQETIIDILKEKSLIPHITYLGNNVRTDW